MACPTPFMSSRGAAGRKLRLQQQHDNLRDTPLRLLQTLLCGLAERSNIQNWVILVWFVYVSLFAVKIQVFDITYQEEAGYSLQPEPSHITSLIWVCLSQWKNLPQFSKAGLSGSPD
ncbi:hypothetical protein N7528_003110 [Penicillium herquei]|nr:hypothetical protein N7528_003110 [Penicillium herquei]